MCGYRRDCTVFVELLDSKTSLAIRGVATAADAALARVALGIENDEITKLKAELAKAAEYQAQAAMAFEENAMLRAEIVELKGRVGFCYGFKGKNLFVLLGDTDGCLHSHLNPVGIADSEEEAEDWCKRSEDAYYRTSYSEVPFFKWQRKDGDE